ncbi:MAG: radical SAM protein [Candidatus Latescibacteria bacterium]|nr:radical SAM protein [Candidatus Latescibacterota bacterium]
MDLLLYNPRSAWSKRRVPMSLLAIGSVLEGRFDYRILDGNFLSDPVRQVSEVIAAEQPEVLGLTVMPGPQLHEAIPLTRALRETFPHLQIVWGGYFPSNHPDVVLRSGWVDFILRGPSEVSFLELMDALKGDDDPRNIPGLSFLDDDRPVHNPARQPMTHPDDLPPWPYPRVGDLDRYLGRSHLGERTTSMHTSYGCPFHCSFCAVVPIYEGGWLGRSGRLLADDVEHVVRRFGVDAIQFCDNNFFTSFKRVHEFSEEVLRRGLRISWWGEGRPDTLLHYPDEVLSTMRRAGCRMIFLGAESGSDEQLRRMNKGGTQTGETVLLLAERFRRDDIIPEFSFVLGGPAEDVGAEIEREIGFIREVKRRNQDAEIILYIYAPVPTPGSDLFGVASQEGFSFPDRLEDWLRPEWKALDLRRNPHTPWLKPRHVTRIADFESVLNAVYPTVSDIRLRPWKRRVLKALGAWRWAMKVYGLPYEIRLFHRLFRYRQPEQEGF